MRRARRRRSGLLVLLLMSLGPWQLQAYDGAFHQHLTFLAAKQFNRCVEGTDVPPLTPLQVRYMARANTRLAERSVFARLFNWRYYDRADQSEQNLLWVVDTRFHDHFNELVDRLDSVDDPVAAYQDLGRVLSYVQLVSSPAHTVPVYTGRFWRFSFGDRFDSYPLDQEYLTTAIDGDCSFLDSPAESYQKVLGAVASRTMASVLEPIPGLPITWTAFWKPDDNPESFGDYGAAGNSFGRRTEFRCGDGQRCVLLKDDPLYLEFARGRHLDALQGSLAAILLMQTSARDAFASAR